MHLVHLDLGPDCIASCLLDWSDNNEYVTAGSRDKRLELFWDSYRQWCEDQHLGERAMRKLFTTNVLKPEGGEYTDISQKVLKAAACRYLLFWLSSVATQFATSGKYPDLQHG